MMQLLLPEHAFVRIPAGNNVNLGDVVERADRVVIPIKLFDITDREFRVISTYDPCMEWKHFPTRSRKISGPEKLAGGTFVFSVIYAGRVGVVDFGA